MPEKLIEVSLPLEAINAVSSREKSIRHGHPSTLHLWWSRKPLAAARAVLFASLVDDPSAHPEEFPTEEEQDQERQRLHKLLADLIKWENSGNPDLLEQARSEIRKSMGDGKLAFLDPFAGGGAIPLEAQRLGLEAHARDLNPVAVLINKAMIEIPPKFANQPPVNPEARKNPLQSWPGASGLAADVEYYGKWLLEEAHRKIGHLYPTAKLPEGGEAPVIAWLWARTVKCPNPICGLEMPLVSSFALSNKKGRACHIEPAMENGAMIFNIKDTGEHPAGTINRHGARCIHCGEAVTLPYIRDEGKAGHFNTVLLGMVAETETGKRYLAPDTEHKDSSVNIKLGDFPENELTGKAKESVHHYGLKTFKDLFTPRQLIALATFCDLISKAKEKAQADALIAGVSDNGLGLKDGGIGAKAYGEVIAVYLTLALDRLADFNNASTSWSAGNEKIMHLFSAQAIPMGWNFPEANVFSKRVGGFGPMVDFIADCLEMLPAENSGVAEQQDAREKDGNGNFIISSDPPYYDNIGYGDISDFFYIWLRKNLKPIFPDVFGTMLTPKSAELVGTSFKFDKDIKKAKDFFETGMLEALRQMRQSARSDVPVTIYYAYKQKSGKGQSDTTGWETMLSSLIEAGFIITGSWPVNTE